MRESSGSIEGRLARLEAANAGLARSNGRWRRATVGLALGAVALVASGQAPAGKEVVTEKLIVQDREGRTKAILGTTDQGTISFTLRDDQNRDRLGVSLGKDGSGGFTILDEQGTGRGSLTVDKEGTGAFGLLGPGGNTSGILMQADASGMVFIGLKDKNAKLRSFWCCRANDGMPLLLMRDADEKEKKRLSAE